MHPLSFSPSPFLQPPDSESTEKAVESLRSGEAARAAAKQMMTRRGSAGRPLSSKLTPGTVKYAVYFVLAFEGPRGLSVTEIVQKVQVRRQGGGWGYVCHMGILGMSGIAGWWWW